MNKQMKCFLSIFILLISKIYSINLIGSRLNTFLEASEIAITKNGGYEEGAFVEWSGSNTDEYSVY